MKRKRKYVVELENHTDSRDNDFLSVWAHTPAEAQNSVKYTKGRETPGRAVLAVQFRKEEGFVPG